MAKLPANAATGANRAGYIDSISCPSPGNCSAVGVYLLRPAKLYRWAELLLTEKAGHWARGVEAALPANANAGPPADAASDPPFGLDSVSCASAGNCTAVGTYNDGSGGIYDEGGRAGLLLTEKAGDWGAGVEARGRANTGFDFGGGPATVSCASAGNCTAVVGGLLFTEKGGRWARGVEAPLPADADPGLPVYIYSVSCSPDGRCSAVGTYNIDFGRALEAGEGVLLTKRAGTWRAVKAVMPPDGPGEGVFLTSVSCASAGNCGAIGFYNINIDSDKGVEGVLLNETDGKWQPGVMAVPPKNASSGPGENSVGLGGISCASPGACVAVGGYEGGSGLTLLTEEAGKWRRGVELALPARHERPSGAISCVSPRSCTVVGDYFDGARYNDFLLTEIAGHWTRTIRATSDPDVYDSVFSVSCAAPGICGAIGRNKRGRGGDSGYGVLYDSTTKPCVVPRLAGRTLARARRSIESHSCSVGRIEHVGSGTIETGRVISQSPQPGARLAPWAKVRLTVSSGR